MLQEVYFFEVILKFDIENLGTTLYWNHSATI